MALFLPPLHSAALRKQNFFADRSLLYILSSKNEGWRFCVCCCCHHFPLSPHQQQQHHHHHHQRQRRSSFVLFCLVFSSKPIGPMTRAFRGGFFVFEILARFRALALAPTLDACAHVAVDDSVMTQRRRRRQQRRSARFLRWTAIQLLHTHKRLQANYRPPKLLFFLYAARDSNTYSFWR